ncbi:response regulator [Desulfurispira natronophila]|uniref:YesN/AraC family two-component response regulator n=1 Tax=Desulfurispira natronophila TaxID=682562 RepID=A0A7W7Y2Y5_9BACT|nr:response regulator [Desulfurispira natronophila]MBB5020832.1 YesN/AraC family two-component response regulator [Desulfurispira natronophila]
MLEKDVMELARKTRVLYVEDDEITRSSIAVLFERIFQEVLLAGNGREGLEAYQQHQPDLIITDITMPIMDGFQMIEAIREKDLDQKIIVISAHGDARFLQRAINLRVNGYVIKPVMQDSLIKSIADSLELLWAKRSLEELNAHLEERVREEVEKNRQKDQQTIVMLEQLLEAYPNPTIVYKEGTVSYLNRAFGHMIQHENYKALIGKSFCLDSLLVSDGECRTSTEEMEQLPYEPHRVCIKTPNGRKIYMVLLRHIQLHNTTHTLFTFNDITLPEYQKIKIAQYTEFLEDAAFSHHRRSQQASQVVQPPPASTEVTPEESSPLKDKAPADHGLDERQKDVLRKSHVEKTSASEFVDDIGEEILYELYELEELEEDMDIALERFEDQPDSASLEGVANLYARYAGTMALLIEFSDLSYAITSLSSMLRNIDLALLDDKKVRALKTYFKTIREDLANWRTTIFVTRESKDIHFLDSSLFSSCLQIEYTVFGKEESEEEEDDDLDIFF